MWLSGESLRPLLRQEGWPLEKKAYTSDIVKPGDRIRSIPFSKEPLHEACTDVDVAVADRPDPARSPGHARRGAGQRGRHQGHVAPDHLPATRPVQDPRRDQRPARPEPLSREVSSERRGGGLLV